MAAGDGLEGWDPFADPADSPADAVEAWRPKPEHQKPLAFAFPFPDSDCESNGCSEAPSTEAEQQQQLLHWGEDPGLEALSGSLGHFLGQAKDEKRQEVCEEELPVLIDDGDLGPRTERLLRGMRSAELEDFEVFADVVPDGELRDLALQACVISKACFADGGTFRLREGRHLALLVDTAHCVTVGYCLYVLTAPEKDKPRTLLVEELAVAEAHRRRGLGSRLLRWAVEAARTERCSVVSIASDGDLDRLLELLGFEAAAAGRAHRAEGRFWQLQLGSSEPGFSASGGTAEPRRPSGEGAGVPEEGPRELEALAGRLRLVCFLASHVSSRERLERLADTLMSIALQEPQGPPEVFMSWSAATEEFRELTRTLLKGFRSKIPGLHAMEQEMQLSQFLHHAAALRKAGTDLRADGWVLFSDDDDLWHPRRYFEFLCAASQVHEDGNVKSVAASGHAQLRLNVEPRAVRPKDVDKLLMQGPLVCGLTDIERKSTDIPEYFDVAVRNEQFKNFLLRTPRALLASKFCDRRFLYQFSLQGWGVAWFRPGSWLYYYSRADGITLAEDGGYKGGASGALSVTDADREAAARHERSRPLAGGHPVSRLREQEVPFLAASFRASIEEQAVTLESMERGWVKAEHLRVVCAMAAQSRAGLEEADARLWAWGTALAWDVAQEVCKALFVRITE